jgi:hypothetical protein
MSIVLIAALRVPGDLSMEWVVGNCEDQRPMKNGYNRAV